MRKMLIVMAAVLTLVSANLFGDTWYLPSAKKYYSANRKFRVDIVPRKLESQLRYFEDLGEGQESPGALPGEDSRRPRAIFRIHRKWWWGYAKSFEFPLVNDVAPVDALISENGEYIVTFDNWHMMGYGDDVVVIYRSPGNVIAKLGLLDLLTEADIATLPRSTSSIGWSGKHRIDEESEQLVLQVVSNGVTGERASQFEELRIDLRTGKPLQIKQDRFLRLYSWATADLGEPPVIISLENMTCRPQEGTGPRPVQAITPRTDTLPPASYKTVPEYPILARAARVQGTVTLAVVIDKTGTVSCAGVISGHPLLNSSAVDAAFQWRFSELKGSVLRTISFSFQQTISKRPPDPEAPK